MCRHCFERGYYGFQSYMEYDAFNQLLTHKLSTKQLVAIPFPSDTLGYPAEQSAGCPSCQEVWMLSSPDHAWRGYWLPVAEALAYQHQLRRRDQRIRLGGLQLLAAAGLALLAKCAGSLF